MKQPLDQYVQLLRSVAEPTRLRVLALLAAGELSVSDIAAVLGQSQPRVSRHLKLLCDAGVLTRSREQHWIYYRLAETGASAEFARSLLESLDVDDLALALDLERARALRAGEAESGAALEARASPDSSEESGELAAVLGAELGEAPIEALLYVGEAPAAVVASLVGRVDRTVALSASRDELSRARARLDGHGLARTELHLGDPRSLPFPAASFDAVILDRIDDPEQSALRDAARVIRLEGRLVLVDDYDRLDERSAGANPLIAFRERLTLAGFHCARLRPLDLDTARLVLAIAAPAARRDAAA